MLAGELIYEDQNMLVLNKPAALEMADLVKGLPAGYAPAHRLDRDTTGLLIIAKNQASLEWFQAQFKARQIKKTYLALVDGAMNEDQGEINLPIGRSTKDPRRRIALPAGRQAGPGLGGKWRPALTRWQVRERFPAHTYLELHPETGRTHQLRAHLKAINRPIVGDLIYNPHPDTLLDVKRQLLHAAQLDFVDQAGVPRHFEVPLPADFTLALANLRSAC